MKAVDSYIYDYDVYSDPKYYFEQTEMDQNESHKANDFSNHKEEEKQKNF